MEKPTKEEFEIFIQEVEETFPMRERILQIHEKIHSNDKLNQKFRKQIEIIKKVSEYLQREYLGEFYIRYKE